MRGEIGRGKIAQPRETRPFGGNGVEQAGKAGGECRRLARKQPISPANFGPFHYQPRQ